ncbi:MAG: RNA methyltransferase [Alphaproteobacteria bacterium]|nr:RNA methyltransferase [Alphaproteobacteria bacterium]
MAGTNNARGQIPDNAAPAPAVILVQPQLGENIGMCARAMLNCAVTDLRIVKPRDGWPNPDAVAAASGAVMLLEQAKVFETTAEAVADLQFVLATTARSRGLVKDIYTAEAAGREIHARHAKAQKCGILFGPERTGLENDDVALANAILNIPLNPGFSSLNLAQAVLLTCYSWLSADNPFAGEGLTPATDEAAPAGKEDIENLMNHLQDELENGGFFRSPDQKPTLMRNIRGFFFRADMTQQDVRTLHGIFACLTGKKSWK